AGSSASVGRYLIVDASMVTGSEPVAPVTPGWPTRTRAPVRAPDTFLTHLHEAALSTVQRFRSHSRRADGTHRRVTRRIEPGVRLIRVPNGCHGPGSGPDPHSGSGPAR